MKPTATPIITHTEILARAIRTFEAEIEEWHSKSDNFPQELIDKATEEPRAKLEALKTLYRREQRLRYKRRQFLYQLRDLEKKGRALEKAGITMDVLNGLSELEDIDL